VEEITARLRILGTSSSVRLKAELTGSDPLQRDKLTCEHARKLARFHSLDETHHPKIITLARAAERFAYRMLRDWREKGTWLVISGQTGCGKSHVARRVATFWNHHKIEAWHQGWIQGDHLPDAEFIIWPIACEAPRDEWKEWLAGIRQARVALFDDVGSESDRFRSGEPAERLREALEATERKWVIVTTNIPAEKWASRFDQRVADRLNKAAHIDLQNVPSYRGKQP
jgi:chromosomal replication initiation ATPase DnaA